MNQPAPSPEPTASGLSIVGCRMSNTGKTRPAPRIKEPRGQDRRDDPAVSWAERVKEYRKRQGSIATLLNQTFGEFGKCHPDRWDGRAYLLLVGMMYERLAIQDQDISTDELLALSKALAEQRRAEAQSGGEHESDGEQAKGGDGRLPGDFEEVVKQIYGTNFQANDSRH